MQFSISDVNKYFKQILYPTVMDMEFDILRFHWHTTDSSYFVYIYIYIYTDSSYFAPCFCSISSDRLRPFLLYGICDTVQIKFVRVYATPRRTWNILTFCYTDRFKITCWIDLSLSARLSVLFSSVQLPGRRFWDIWMKFHFISVLAQRRTRLIIIRNGVLLRLLAI